MTTALFWLTAGGLLLLLLYFLLRTLLRTAPVLQSNDTEQKIAVIYRDRLQQLEQQFTNGELGQDDYDLARTELSQALARELQPVATPAAIKAQRVAEKPARILPWVIGGGVPLLAVALYLTLGQPTALQPATASAPVSVDEMVARLEKRLQSAPDDAVGWRMLGRSYDVLGRLPDADRAYAQAWRLTPDDPDLALDYAEVLARTNNNSLQGRPAELIEAALRLDPRSVRAKILRGIALYQQERMTEAVAIWKSILNNNETADPEVQRVLEILIAGANSNSSSNGSSEKSAAPKPADAPVTSAIKVRVKLAPALAAAASPGDTLFIFAQAAEGPKMPLAVVRKQVADLPLTITLDDSSAMTPNLRLSAFDRVQVVARISKSGNAIGGSGDLQGKSAVLDPHAKPSTDIVIDTRLP
jgi:cytochrome c-type biogenesis protein CcmH